MADYEYLGVTPDGKRTKGRLSAGSVQEALKLLADRQVNCIHIETAEEKKAKTVYRMKKKEVIFFCRQVRTMLKAGITLSRIFDILKDKSEKPKMRLLYQNVYEGLQKGGSLSAVMAEQGNSFPELLIQMTASGEASGNLEEVMMRLEGYFSNDLKLSNKVRTAMIYPVILLVVALGVIVLIFNMVLPRLFTMFEGVSLPWNTRLLIWLSKSMSGYWYIWLLIIAVIVLAIRGIRSTEHGKLFFDSFKLKLPKFGRLLKVVYTSRFANSFATLYASGITVSRGLTISGRILGNSYVGKRFSEVEEQVQEGRSLAVSIENMGLFDTMFTSLLYVGEESGNLDEVLIQASEYYDQEAQVALERMVAILEPLLIILLAVIIGFIVISVIVPIYQMYGNIV